MTERRYRDLETPQCHFVFFTGSRTGLAEGFEASRITIGRAAGCDFRIDGPLEEVSNHHAEIIFESGCFYLYDLETSSGTYVNGIRIGDRVQLMSEDFVRFGEHGPEVIYRVGRPGPGNQTVPEIHVADAKLTFFSGNDGGRSFPVLPRQVTRIGRRQELEIGLDAKGDMIVSGNHCNIAFRDGSFLLSDTSRNGTYVNGVLVEGIIEILDGDVIMLGDGGPQARFKTKPMDLVYPNLTRERKSLPAAAVQEELLAKEEPRRLQEESPAPAALDVRDADLPSPPDRAAVVYDDASRPSIPKKVPILLSIVAVGAICLTLALLISMIKSRNEPRVPAQSFVETLRIAQANRKDLPNPVAKFSVAVPQGWTTRKSNESLSILSPDREFAVDYARSGQLNDLSVMSLLGTEGATVQKVAQPGAKNDTQYSLFIAKTGGLARLAMLHEPANQVPALAYAELNAKYLPQLDPKLLTEFLVSNLKLEKMDLPPKPKPSPTPKPPTPSPTPQKTVAAVAAPTPSPSPVRAAIPTATPAATPAPTETPQATATPTASPGTAATIVSEGLGLQIQSPDGWQGSINEKLNIMSFVDDDGLDVRLTRDPQKLDMDAVVKGMTKDGWTRAGAKDEPEYSVRELAKQDERVLLVLIPESKSTTLVLYATRTGNITELQRTKISKIVKQLRTAAKQP